METSRTECNESPHKIWTCEKTKSESKTTNEFEFNISHGASAKKRKRDDAEATGSVDDKPLCKYGKDCYRKNGEHLQQYSHKVDGNRISNDSKKKTHKFDEVIEPYRLLLTKVKGIEPDYNAFLSMGIKDILSPSMGNLTESAQFNYMIDVEWLMEQYPKQFRTKPLLLVCGQDKDKGRAMLSDITPFPNVSLCQARLDIPYGTHHTKMMFLLYDVGLRIVIHTSNLVHSDWYQKTQGMWISTVCPLLSESNSPDNGESVTGFKADIIDYISAYRKTELSPWIKHIRDHDLSKIKVHLIGSVPGRHSGSSKHSWGHLKLRTILKKHGPSQESSKSWPVIGQFSSVGSMGQTANNWLTGEFLQSLSTTRDSALLCAKPALQLVFPTKDNVRLSLEGYPAGASLPYSINVAKRQPYLTTFFHQWKSNGRGRSRASPHIKSYLRYCPISGQSPWFILTSANLSKAAWGTLEKNQSQLMIRSYELGVLFLPKHLIGEDTFSISSSLDKLKASRNVFPLPYDLPPKPYSSTDKPWIWDIAYKDLPDTNGNMWCPT